MIPRGRALADGDQGDDRADADDHAEHRQGRPQPARRASREMASRTRSSGVHATSRPSRTWTWRSARRGDVAVVGDEHDRPARRVELVEDAHDLGARCALSRLPVGSSARMSAGSVTRARAMATRCCWPPDSSVGSWSSRSPSPSRSSAALRPLERARGGRRPGRAAASPRCRGRSSAAAGCTTGRRSRSTGCGPRRGRRRRGPRRPSRRGRSGPAVGRSRQPTMFISVDLPDPDGPTMARNSPRSTTRSTPSSARTSIRPVW